MTTTGPTPTSTPTRTYDRHDLELIDAYWRAANYLSVGQIYLMDNPLQREPLRAEHVPPPRWASGAPRRA